MCVINLFLKSREINSGNSFVRVNAAIINNLLLCDNIKGNDNNMKEISMLVIFFFFHKR